jgi:glutamine amidotransferase
MQLLCKHSEENDTTCMGVFDVAIKRFQSTDLKIPHVGWNSDRSAGPNSAHERLKGV